MLDLNLGWSARGLKTLGTDSTTMEGVIQLAFKLAWCAISFHSSVTFVAQNVRHSDPMGKATVPARPRHCHHHGYTGVSVSTMLKTSIEK